MPKKRLPIRSAGPNDPIYQEGFTVFTPLWARPGFKPPEPKAEDKPSEPPESEGKPED